MDSKTHVLQGESKGEPMVQIESEVEATTNVPVTEGVDMEEEKSVMAEIGLGEAICTIDQIEVLKNTEQVDVEVERVDNKDYEVVNSEDMTHLASLNDKVITDTRGDKGSDINVVKLDDKDGHLKVNGENGSSLEEKSDDYDDIKDINDEYHLLVTPTKEDREESALFNISNNSFMFDPLLQIERKVEQTTDVPVNEGVDIEEQKSVKSEIGLSEAVCTIGQMDCFKNTLYKEVEKVDKKDDEVVNFEDKTHLASQNDKVITAIRGGKGSNINVEKLENKEGHLKVDCKNGTTLEEKSDKYHDIKDIIGECHLLFAPTKQDREENELFNISNNSFMFEPLLQIESEVEPTTDLPVNEGVDIEEKIFVNADIGLGEAIYTIDQMEDLKNTKQVDVDVEVERAERKDDEVVNFEDKTHVISMNDKFVTKTRGYKGSDTNVEKLETKDGHSKVGGENGASLHEKSNKYDDINGEKHRLFAPTKKYKEEISLFNISNNPFMFDCTQSIDDSDTEEEQEAFLNELEQFHKNNSMEFKPPKFYGKGLNYLKLWRQVTRLGGYDQVTSQKMWRQVGESFKPPKTCTTVSWSFRNFYEKVLLEYEKHKTNKSELKATASTLVEQNACEKQVDGRNGCGRVRRESATRAMQSWHSLRLPTNGSTKRKRMPIDEDVKDLQHIPDERQNDSMVIDMGPPADWIKINVLRTKDSYEVYALIPGLEREELRVQSDPVGRLIITGEPTQVDNPWGITRFKKVIILPSRIDPGQTSASLNNDGRCYISAAFEKSES